MQKSAETGERSKTPEPAEVPKSAQKEVKGSWKRKPKPQVRNKQRQQEQHQPGASVQMAQPLLPCEAATTLLKPFSELEAMIDKRRRNLEKRKEKLQNYGRQLRNGNALAEDQMNAYHKLDDVKQQLEYLQELKAAYLAGSEKLQQAMNLLKKLEKMEFVKRIASFMRYKEILTVLQDQEIRQLFTMGTSGTVKLSAKELAVLDALYPRIHTALNLVPNIGVWHGMLQNAAQKAMDITFGSNNTVIGMHKGSDVQELLERISCCKFFQTVPEWLHDRRFAAIRTAALVRNGADGHINRNGAAGDSADGYVNDYAPNSGFVNGHVNGRLSSGLITKYMPTNTVSSNKTSNSRDSSSKVASQPPSSEGGSNDQNMAQREGANRDSGDSNSPNTSDSRPSYTHSRESQKSNGGVVAYFIGGACVVLHVCVLDYVFNRLSHH